MGKQINPNLVKIHRNYTVEEISVSLSVHKNTVRTWIQDGLPICDDRRPVLVLGLELKQYLQKKRSKNKRRCQSYEIYCMRCKAPKRPYGNMVDYEFDGATGCLVGICPVCDCVINKFISRAGLARIGGELDITMPSP